MFARLRPLVAVASLGYLSFAAVAGAQVAPPARLVIIAGHTGDARLSLVGEAVEFWRATLGELGLEPVFSAPEVMMLARPDLRTLENLARRLSQRSGRGAHGGLEPDPPRELAAIGGDVVLLLSSQNILPFAWPLPARESTPSVRFFVVIRAERSASVGARTTLRNVIAHELGHTLGLRHAGNPAVLMCMPCDQSPGSEPAGFPPLTARDRSRLRELYGATAATRRP